MRVGTGISHEKILTRKLTSDEPNFKAQRYGSSEIARLHPQVANVAIGIGEVPRAQALRR